MVLFSPIRINSLQIKNRIVMPAMHLGYCQEGFVNDRLVEFYKERARGGVGMIIVGGCSIDLHGYDAMIRIDHDRFLPGLARLADEVKKSGAPVCAQLFQPGRYSYAYAAGITPVAPSAVASRLTGQVPRELSEEEIYNLIETFGEAAARVRQAGFDAVEIIGSVGYIISQFLSPLTNLRDDFFGGDLQSRMRFGLLVVRKVREKVGPGFPVIFRVGGSDFMPGGSTPEEITGFCVELEKAGIDAFNITGGWHESRVPQIAMNVPRGAFTYLARKIKETVSIPVIACNRINSPELAEKIVSDGIADMVGMARGLIADPELPVKAKAGRYGEIRNCIGCNQGCLEAVFTSGAVRCLVNARAGREAETVLQPADQAKKVLVVGGGPAGMEAARIAALRGHRVTLWEKSACLGGQLRLASAPRGREEFLSFVAYLAKQMEALGVQLELSREATEDEVLSFGADAVIIATGAKPAVPPVDGVDSPNVVQAWDVLSGKVLAGRSIVIIGAGGVGCETALYLAQKGTLDAGSFYFLALNNAEPVEKLIRLATIGVKKVTVVEMRNSPACDISVTSRWIVMQDIKRYGINVLTGAQVVKIKEGAVVILRGDRQEEIEADTVVLAAGALPEYELCEKLKEKVKEIYMIGDAVVPGKALEAIYDGFIAGQVL